MRRGAYLLAILAWVLVPLSLSRAEQTLQQRYLDIFLTLNTAEHLEKQGDFRGALDAFQDCYKKLAKIHEEDPNWEAALVVHRMDDCKAEILALTPKAEAQPLPSAPVPPESPMPAASGDTNAPSTVPPVIPAEDVSALKQELQAVKDELKITKAKLADSEAQNETYREQLATVNQQLAALKSEQTVDDKMGKLLSDNKDLTDKLTAAQKQIDDYKSSPKSKLALAEAQLKNLQDQYNESQEANKALQDTTTTLKQQLDQAQADLVAANQKLAAAGPASPEYTTLKRENEVMRDILTRELQEQAHRDMAKRLAQEEFDNLKLKSQVLQQNLDILATPMTPATTDEERALLASLKVPGPDVTQMPGNTFTANATGAQTPPQTPPSTDTNATAATPPATDAASTPATPASTNSTANEPPVNIVMNQTTPPSTDPGTTPPATNAVPDASVTNATPAPAPAITPANSAPPTPPASTPANPPDTSAATPPAPPASTNNTATVPSSPPTSTVIPPGQTVVQTTVTQGGDSAPTQSDPTQYSTKARLPDDMRETAQDAADLFKNQKYDESAAKYQSIIDKYPESLYAWSNLGVVRFQQGKFDEALKALQQAVKLSPTDAFSYSNLGIVYYQLGQYENAIDALNSAKALDPNDAKTHNYLGCAESQKGWQMASETEFRKAIEIDPNFGDAHFNLALVYATSKPPSLELARREYNRALELGIGKDPRLEKLLGGTSEASAPAP